MKLSNERRGKATRGDLRIAGPVGEGLCLTLDLGFRYGWAVVDLREGVKGNLDAPPIAQGAGKMSQYWPNGKRYIELTRFILDKHDEYKYTTIAIENLSYGYYCAQDFISVCGYTSSVEMAAHVLNCELVTLYPVSVKKHFAGSGKAKKVDMIAEYLKRYGPDDSKLKKVDDNKVDAVALGYCTLKSKFLNGLGCWENVRTGYDYREQTAKTSIQREWHNGAVQFHV